MITGEMIRFIKSNKLLYQLALRANRWYRDTASNSKAFRTIIGGIRGYREWPVRAMSVSQYCDENGIDRLTLQPAGIGKEYRSAFYEGAPAEVIESPAPEIFSCVLTNVYVMGARDAVITKDYYLDEHFAFPDSNRIRLESENVLHSKEGWSIYGRIGRTIQEAILLTGEASNNYYHWTQDILSKMAFINMRPDLKDVPLIIDREVEWQDTYVELLHIVDTYQHPIIVIDRGECVCVQRLHYVSPCTLTFPYMRTPGWCYIRSEHVMNMYRDKLLAGVENVTLPNAWIEWPKYIVIYRGSDKVKRLANEPEVAARLQQHGFKAVDPGALSIRQQAALFHNATMVIGDEGAALTNIIYASEHTTLVCIEPYEWGDRLFSTIGHYAGAKCINLNATLLEGEGRYHVVDIDYLERFIAEYVH